MHTLGQSLKVLGKGGFGTVVLVRENFASTALSRVAAYDTINMRLRRARDSECVLAGQLHGLDRGAQLGGGVPAQHFLLSSMGAAAVTKRTRIRAF